MKTKIAKCISIIGHPLLTIPVFVLTALFNFESVEKASGISVLIIGGIFIPLIVKMYHGERSGKYSNFDVSNKSERQSWYTYVLILLAVITLTAFITGQSRTVCLSLLFSTLLLCTSQFINRFIKSSLHISLNVFLFFMILHMNPVIAFGFAPVICLIAWARLALKRHTPKELVMGALIGFSWGALFWIFMNLPLAIRIFQNL
jgi:membrane-associated phospholipid phosphatase